MPAGAGRSSSDGTPVASSANTIVASSPEEDGSGWATRFFATRIEPDGVTRVRAHATFTGVD